MTNLVTVVLFPVSSFSPDVSNIERQKQRSGVKVGIRTF